MTDKIDRFDGEYYFLSNFYPTTVYFEGFAYPSAEHAYVAGKTEDETLRRVIAKIPTAGEAKRYGRKIRLRKDFDSLKLGMMMTIVYSKFSRNLRLKENLIDTGDAELIEGNTWGDTYWGVCEGVGHNFLGKALMTVRKEINA